MKTVTMTYRGLMDTIRALRGSPEEPGIAFRRLPAATILLPLRRFVKEAEAQLETFNDVSKELQEAYARAEEEGDEGFREEMNEEYQALLEREVSFEVMPVSLSALEGREDLSLADLMTIDFILEDE